MAAGVKLFGISTHENNENYEDEGQYPPKNEFLRINAFTMGAFFSLVCECAKERLSFPFLRVEFSRMINEKKGFFSSLKVEFNFTLPHYCVQC